MEMILHSRQAGTWRRDSQKEGPCKEPSEGVVAAHNHQSALGHALEGTEVSAKKGCAKKRGKVGVGKGYLAGLSVDLIFGVVVFPKTPEGVLTNQGQDIGKRSTGQPEIPVGGGTPYVL